MGFFDSFFSSSSAQNVPYTALNLGNASDIYSQFLGQSSYLPSLSAFNSAVNSQYQQQLNETSPGLLSGLASASKNAASLAKGEIPTDVAEAIGRSSAAANLSSGVGVSSGMGRNMTARDLGLTSLQLQSQGTQQLQSVLGMSQSLNPYSLQNELFSPSQLLQRSDQEKVYNWQGQNQNNATNAAINTYNQNQNSPFENLLLGGVSSLFSGATGGSSLGLSSGVSNWWQSLLS